MIKYLNLSPEEKKIVVENRKLLLRYKWTTGYIAEGNRQVVAHALTGDVAKLRANRIGVESVVVLPASMYLRGERTSKLGIHPNCWRER